MTKLSYRLPFHAPILAHPKILSYILQSFFGERDVQIFHLEKKVNMHRSLPPYYKGKLNFLKHCALSKQQSDNFIFKKQKHVKRYRYSWFNGISFDNVQLHQHLFLCDPNQ